MKKVLTIAASDCSGGAGIQADLKTIGAFGMYGMSVVTAITVQNTCGVYRVEALSASLVEEQLRAVFEDIRPDAVKIGMVVDREIICAVASVLAQYHIPIVLDPVMISTSGRELLDPAAVRELKETLFPLVWLITPNLPEAEALGGTGGGEGKTERESAAQTLSEQFGCSVLIKGGHGGRGADDILYHRETGVFTWYENERIDNRNTHGTGCTLSSAIACGLAAGQSLEDSVGAAKEYITGAIRDGLDLGRGNGPLNHFYKSNYS